MYQDSPVSIFPIFADTYLGNKSFILFDYHEKEKLPGNNALVNITLPPCPLLFTYFFIEIISIWTRIDMPMYIFLEITACSVPVLSFK